MADVFISYKRDDRPVAERLANALRQLGFEVWWDFELLSGEDFRHVIRAVIDQCKSAVIVWSRASVQSSFVIDEASYALRLGRICPVRLDAVELPFGFGQRHVDDLSGWGGELSHPGFQRLVKAIEDRVGRMAKLGGDMVAPERQAASAELEGFKAAQLAGNVEALRTFVANFPAGAFAPFVRDQIERLEQERPSRTGARAMPTAPTVEAGAGRRRLLMALVAVGLAMAATGGYLYWHSHQRARDAELAASRQVDEERIVANRRAEELQAQAAAERTARERAEQRGEALQRQAEQERQAREQAARLESERARRETAFSLDVLHPDLRGTIVAARRNAVEAESAAIRARTTASLAEAAAQRAGAGKPGAISLGFDGGTYLGEGSGNARNGLGVTTHRAPSMYAGDRFAGQYRDNMRSGLGVYTFAENSGNSGAGRKLRREGEYSANAPTGFGVLLFVSGERHAGHWKDGNGFGPGVRTFADGRRYEGDFVDSKRNGLGVLWSADGKVVGAGIWKDGKLATAMLP